MKVGWVGQSDFPTVLRVIGAFGQSGRVLVVDTDQPTVMVAEFRDGAGYQYMAYYEDLSLGYNFGTGLGRAMGFARRFLRMEAARRLVEKRGTPKLVWVNPNPPWKPSDASIGGRSA